MRALREALSALGQWFIYLVMIPESLFSLALSASRIGDSLAEISSLSQEFCHRVPKSPSSNSLRTSSPVQPGVDTGEPSLFQQSDEELAVLEALELEKTRQGGEVSLDTNLEGEYMGTTLG